MKYDYSFRGAIVRGDRASVTGNEITDRIAAVNIS